MYFLVEGRVKLSRLSTSGKEFILAIVEPGSFFGETGVLDERPRETMAEALETSTFLVVRASVFRGLLKRRPELLMKLAQLMGRRQTQLEKQLMDVVYQERPLNASPISSFSSASTTECETLEAFSCASSSANRPSVISSA